MHYMSSSTAQQTDRGDLLREFSIDPLFAELRTEKIALRNRLAMSPMTRAFSPQGIPDPGTPDYYRRRAAGGIGLVITEGAAPPHAVAHHSTNIPNFYGDALPVWREVAAAVHDAGAKIFVQLWHAGLGRRPAETLNPEEPSVGPSGYMPDGHQPARAMTERDIADVIDAFATAARSAKDIGFDGVNIHGAHGYLLDQFFWSRTNLRKDRYNGDIEERSRFAVEVISAMRRAVGPDFPIMLRWSQWKGPDYEAKLVENPKDLARFLEPLVDAGVDLFDCSTRRFWLPEFAGSDLNLAGWTRKVTGKPTMTVGSVGLEAPLSGRRMDTISSSEVSLANLTRLMEMFNRGDFDLVALGRSILMNPTWPQLIRERRFSEIRTYDHQRVAKYLECAD
jgi:2,4-dienoyl-CoA reductase-like NADH-dependent reductase (Old Yellow Enzyme family)